MDPAGIELILTRQVSASPGGVLAIPLPPGSGLPLGLAGRLDVAGRLLSPTGSLAVTGVTTTHDATVATVRGRISLIGLQDLVFDLSLGPGDAFSLTVTLAPGAPGPLHLSLAWTALTVGFSAVDGDSDVAATLDGELSVAGRRLSISLHHFDAGPPTIWSLRMSAGGSVSLAELTGLGDDEMVELADHLPAVATVAAAITELTLVTSGNDPRLAVTIPLVETLPVVTGTLTMATTSLSAMLRFAMESDMPAVGAFEVAGVITALGGTQTGSVRLTSTPAGFEFLVALAPGSTSLLTVAGLCRALLGREPDDVLAAFPDGLRTRVAASGFTDLEVRVGPLPGTFGIEGTGTFLGWPARGRVRIRPWLGGDAVSIDLLPEESPATVADIVKGLGIEVSDIVRRHLPTVAVGLRELRYDPSGPEFDLGGVLSDGGWELDVRVGLGAGSCVTFEAGRLYGGGGKSLPTLTQLLGSLLPSSAHAGLLSAIEAVVPDALNTLIAGTTVYHAEVSWAPGSATSPSSLSIEMIVAIATKGDPLVSTLAMSHVDAAPGGHADWRVQLTSPFLRGDIVEIARTFGLPDSGLGLTPGQLQLSCPAVDIGSDGVDLSFELDVEGKPAEIRARVQRNGQAWDWKLQLSVGAVTFDLDVKTGPTGPPTFHARLVEPDGGLRVADIAGLLGVDDVPDVLDLNLEQVEIHFVPAVSGVGVSATIGTPDLKPTIQMATRQLGRTPPVRAWVMDATIPSAHFGLDGIPILGQLIPDGSAFRIDIENLDLRYSSLDLSRDEIDLIAPLLTGPSIITPGLGLDHGLTLGGTLRIGATTVSVGRKPPEALPMPAVAPVAAIPGVQAAPVPTPAPPAGALAWRSVGVALGPIYIATVGVGYAGGQVLVGVTGSLRLAVLELTLVGLRVGIPVAAFTDAARVEEVTFALDGVGIEVRAPGITVGGALVHMGDRLDGAALVSAQGTSINLMASLTRTTTGQPSVFMYGVLNRAIGGPAFFYVTGLAAGFGYNRGFVEPAIEAVPEFPLVKSALGHGAQPDTVAELIELLGTPEVAQAFPVSDGALFLAAGVKFTSFKVVESFLLLAVVLGARETTVLLLGTSRLELPPKLPDTAAPAPPVPPVAVVNLALRAKYEVERGRLEVRGQLVDSYILSHACTITGGFAVLAFFQDDPTTGARAGDFVVTIGGYHPHFAPAPWYPVVPRLALTWRVDENLHVKGSAYFALTPNAAMAGGNLDACWESGGLSARFTLAADFLIQWRPYHYEASFGMGVRGTLRWGALEFSVNVHADIDLYGPPFGGRATLDLGVVSKSVEFGADRPVRVPLPVADFPGSFLPAPTDVCGATLAAGAVGHDATSGVWSVAPGPVEITVHTAVPVTAASMGVDALAALTANGPAVGVLAVDAPAGLIQDVVHLAPCEESATAAMAIAVVRHDPSGEVDTSTLFVAAPAFKQLPTALWNHAGADTSAPPSTAANATVTALAGFVLRAAPAPPPKVTARLALANLEVERLGDSVELAGLSLRVTLGPIAAATPSPRRDVLAGLGFDPDAVAALPRPVRAVSAASLAGRRAAPSAPSGLSVSLP